MGGKTRNLWLWYSRLILKMSFKKPWTYLLYNPKKKVYDHAVWGKTEHLDQELHEFHEFSCDQDFPIVHHLWSKSQSNICKSLLLKNLQTHGKRMKLDYLRLKLWNCGVRTIFGFNWERNRRIFKESENDSNLFCRHFWYRLHYGNQFLKK